MEAEKESTIMCYNCLWEGQEEDLKQYVEFTTGTEIIYSNGCPNCKTDEYLTDA